MGEGTAKRSSGCAKPTLPQSALAIPSRLGVEAPVVLTPVGIEEWAFGQPAQGIEEEGYWSQEPLPQFELRASLAQYPGQGQPERIEGG